MALSVGSLCHPWFTKRTSPIGFLLWNFRHRLVRYYWYWACIWRQIWSNFWSTLGAILYVRSGVSLRVMFWPSVYTGVRAHRFLCIGPYSSPRVNFEITLSVVINGKLLLRLVCQRLIELQLLAFKCLCATNTVQLRGSTAHACSFFCWSKSFNLGVVYLVITTRLEDIAR